MKKIIMIVSFIVTIFVITGCKKKPSPEEIRAYEIRKEKADGFRIYGTIDERLEAYVISTFRSTADPDKLKECSTYNTLHASRRRFLDYEVEIIEDTTSFDFKIPIEYISKEDKCGMEYVDTEIRISRKGDKGEKDEGALMSRWVLFSTSRVKAAMVTNYDKDKYINGKLVKKGEEYFSEGRAKRALHNPIGTGSVLIYSSKDAPFYYTKKKYFFLNNILEFKCHTYFDKSIVKGEYYKKLTCYPTNFKQAKGMDKIPSGTIDIELHIDVDDSKK
ncbi:hypothetical protein CRU99_13750 [Malaciobacter mytili]|uniref:hypothetical protein n=1 Tax=Malaciobacter mytili TaxID=603050 RepID=UPI00100C35F7|nr:hypothetical protein [Malaciobacter mytili]RXI35846.1 hypothetical protein CRU99_13750 [Malaciobacter mytili]